MDILQDLKWHARTRFALVGAHQLAAAVGSNLRLCIGHPPVRTFVLWVRYPTLTENFPLTGFSKNAKTCAQKSFTKVYQVLVTSPYCNLKQNQRNRIILLAKT